MKKLLNLIVLFLCILNVFAQKYVSFPTKNAQWKIYHSFYDESYMAFPQESFETIAIQGDTLISGKNYSKLYDIDVENLGDISLNYLGAIREESKRIYYTGELCQWMDLEEILIYDFNLKVGDLFEIPMIGNSRVLSIDSVLVGDTYRKAYNVSGDYIIEGIGSANKGLLTALIPIPTCFCTTIRHLTCFSENNQSLYNNPRFKGCESGEYRDDISFTIPYGDTIRWTMYKMNEWDYSEDWVADKDTIIYNDPNTYRHYKKIRRVNNVPNEDFTTWDDLNLRWRDLTQTSNTNYESVMIGTDYSYNKIYMYNLLTKKEDLISDIGLQKADTFFLPSGAKGKFLEDVDFAIVDSVYYYNDLRHVQLNLTINSAGTKLTFIQGIGPNAGFLYAMNNYPNEFGFELNCYKSDYLFYKNNKILLPCGCDLYDGVKDVVSLADKIQLFPNPVIDWLSIRFEADYNDLIFRMYDIQGRMVLQTPLNLFSNSVNLSDINSGLYLFRILKENKLLKTGKIIKL